MLSWELKRIPPNFLTPLCGAGVGWAMCVHWTLRFPCPHCTLHPKLGLGMTQAESDSEAVTSSEIWNSNNFKSSTSSILKSHTLPKWRCYTGGDRETS